MTSDETRDQSGNMTTEALVAKAMRESWSDELEYTDAPEAITAALRAAGLLVEGGPTGEPTPADRELSVLVELVSDLRIGERMQEIMRDVIGRKPEPTAEDLAATPHGPGLYLDRLGNVWHLYQDGVFAMSSRIRASAAHYAPFKRLQVVDAAGVAPPTPSAYREHLAERLRQFAESQRMDFDSSDVAAILERAADALTAPAPVDEAKLAEVMDKADVAYSTAEHIADSGAGPQPGPWFAWLARAVREHLDSLRGDGR